MYCHLFSVSCAAVRFGRIPKREKQRMLAEMQSAMNNMANNQLSAQCLPENLPTGHLQSSTLLLGHQSQLAPSSPPSRAASPPPISPCYSQFPQQLTPPRSPSPGDVMEDVITQVAKAHKEIFVYAHDKLATGPQPPTGSNSSPSWDNNWLINGHRTNGLHLQNDNWNTGSASRPACHQNTNGHRFCPSGEADLPLRQGETRVLVSVTLPWKFSFAFQIQLLLNCSPPTAAGWVYCGRKIPGMGMKFKSRKLCLVNYSPCDLGVFLSPLFLCSRCLLFIKIGLVVLVPQEKLLFIYLGKNIYFTFCS